MNRDEYAAKLKARIDRWNADIDHLEMRLKRARSSAQAEAAHVIDELRAKRDAVVEQSRRLQHSAGAAWKELGRGADSAGDSLADAIRRAKDRFDSDFGED